MAELLKLKRAVIKEEYVAITGDFIKATILNQFIYWSERVKDFDVFIEQENKRAIQHGLTEQDITGGWLYKTAEELSEETMLGLSVASMRTHIKALIDLNYISERNNPKYKWDRTKQYRVNLVEIAKALNDKGFGIEGYKIKLPFLDFKNADLEIKTQTNENLRAIPEITTETKKEITTDIIKDIIAYLNEKAGTSYKYKSAKTQTLIKARLNEDFTLDDFKVVIDKKVKEWQGTDMAKYLRPETLFGTKFESYLNQVDKTIKQPKEQNLDFDRKFGKVL